MQAHAAGRAGRLLREAVEVTAGAAAAREYRPRQKRTSAVRARSGPRLAATGGQPMAGVVQQAVPAHAREVLADPAWPALRVRLTQVAQDGEDPAEVLSTVAARRELQSADSVAEVLTWRLDGWRRQRSSSHGPTTSAGGAGGTGPARTPGVAAPTRRPGDEQRRGPKRAR